MEQLKAKEVIVKATACTEGGAGLGDAAQQPESVEAAPGATKLDRSGGDGQEPGSTTRTLEAIEAGEAATSTRDAGHTDVEQTRNVVETPWDAGKEEEPSELWSEREEPQQQQRQEERLPQPQPEAEQRELG
jgi:hypothetical protein